MKEIIGQEKDEEALLKDMENCLQKHLIEVNPRRAFVDSLHLHLMTAPEPQPSPLSQFLIFGLGGILISLLAVILGVKASIALLTAFGLINQMKHQAGDPAQVQHRPLTGS